jgi:hypothetical protein
MRVFDSHLHIIDQRFPLVSNRGYLPDEFTVADYRARVSELGIMGGAVVSGSFQAFDQSYLLDALRTLGPSFVGVTQLPSSTPDAEILALDRAGGRAVRFNLKRGGSAGLGDLDSLARRVHEVAGWHVELYVDGRDLPELYEVLVSLPVVVIDHLGLSRAGLPTLLRLAERGAHVKATGFGRLDFDPGPALHELARVNPDALLFGTDLPSTRAPRPFRVQDLSLITEALEPEFAAKRSTSTPPNSTAHATRNRASDLRSQVRQHLQTGWLSSRGLSFPPELELRGSVGREVARVASGPRGHHLLDLRPEKLLDPFRLRKVKRNRSAVRLQYEGKAEKGQHRRSRFTNSAAILHVDSSAR